MPKSKEFIESSDSDNDEKSGTATATGSKKTTAKDSNNKNDSSAKRVKTSNQVDGAGASKTGTNGEQLYEIGKSRYVSVSTFKSKPYVNIREYYEDHGVEKPGRKGISLPGDQWEKLKSLINQVDKDLKKSK